MVLLGKINFMRFESNLQKISENDATQQEGIKNGKGTKTVDELKAQGPSKLKVHFEGDIESITTRMYQSLINRVEDLKNSIGDVDLQNYRLELTFEGFQLETEGQSIDVDPITFLVTNIGNPDQEIKGVLDDIMPKNLEGNFRIESANLAHNIEKKDKNGDFQSIAVGSTALTYD